MPEIDFITYLKTLKPEDWQKKVADGRTIKEVIAHMVGWEKHDPGIIRTTWKTKKIPWFYQTDDYEDFNKKNIEYYKDYKPAELIKEWEKWQKKVKEEIDRIGEDKLKPRPDLFGWLFDKSEKSHYNLHYQEIRAVIEKD